MACAFETVLEPSSMAVGGTREGGEKNGRGGKGRRKRESRREKESGRDREEYKGEKKREREEREMTGGVHQSGEIE